MPPRDTTTGRVLEEMVLPALKKGGYTVLPQKFVGKRLGVTKHKVDIVAQKGDSKRILISLKWQETSGTAEQKVAFEMICLISVIRENQEVYEKAYIVMGGDGWKLRDAYVEGKLSEYIKDSSLVTPIKLESFIALANQGKL